MDAISLLLLLAWLLLLALTVKVFMVEAQIAGIGHRLSVLNERIHTLHKLLADRGPPHRSPFPEPPPVDPEVAAILRDKPIAPPPVGNQPQTAPVNLGDIELPIGDKPIWHGPPPVYHRSEKKRPGLR